MSLYLFYSILVVLVLQILAINAQYNGTSSNSTTLPTAGSALAPANATVVNGTTVSPNPSAFATTIDLRIEQYWDLYVGPVSTASITTTASATPIPSSALIPPPPLYYSPWLTGQENAAVTKNESWSFPKEFFWGVASAAYQIEGAMDAEGRGPSIWDVFTHRAEGYTLANQTGDVGCNEYYLYKQDIAYIAAMGVPYYSFSISWSRVFPWGRGPGNELALAHYEDVINTCLEYGVKPIVTLMHWDLPLYLQNLYGGWLSEEIIDDYVNYAKVVFARFGNKVPHWFTINEPIVVCQEYPFPKRYFSQTNIPDKDQQFFCGHHLILAHAGAYHAAKSLNLTGTISLKLNGGWKLPFSNSSADAEAIERAWSFNEAWFYDPIFTTGDYPPYLKEHVASLGLSFTPEQSEYINNTADILAHDAYTTEYFSAPDDGFEACVGNYSHSLYPSCVNGSFVGEGGWLVGPAADPATNWLYKATEWVPTFLAYLQERWGKGKGIVVSEFGFAEPFEAYKTYKADILFDPIRTSYYHDYMEAILMAIAEGTNVVGCIAWSIMDNLEWSSGLQVKFGLMYINLTTFEKSYKASFFEYVNAFKVYAEDPVVPVYAPLSS